MEAQPRIPEDLTCMMREHHAGAISMAEQELEAGEFLEAKELSQQIIDAQRAEIGEIDRLLTS